MLDDPLPHATPPHPVAVRLGLPEHPIDAAERDHAAASLRQHGPAAFTVNPPRAPRATARGSGSLTLHRRLPTRLCDGERGAAYSRVLLGRDKPLEHAGDAAYAEAMLDEPSAGTVLKEAALAAELAAVAGDLDLFCFAERAALVMRAVAADGRLPGSPPVDVPHGALYLVAPLCVLYDSAAEVFLVFRALWRGLWRPMLLGGREHGDAGVTEAIDAAAVQLCDARLGRFSGAGRMKLAQVVRQWLVQGFAGFMPLSQTLLSWDAAVMSCTGGDEALRWLASVADAVLELRAAALAAARDAAEAAELLRDLSDVDVELMFRERQ